jgi:hypothetical protein
LVNRRYDAESRFERDGSQISEPIDVKPNYVLPSPLKGKKSLAFFLGAHLPRRIDKGMEFYVSVQNKDETEFSPRPAEAWVEIRPIAPGKPPEESPVLCYYDLTFKPGCPVPVLSDLYPNWPAEARKAEIRVWFKLEKTPADKGAFPVAEFLRKKNMTVNDGKGNVKFDIVQKRGDDPAEPNRLVVNETHAPGGDLGTLKVALMPTPEKTVHRYNFKNNSVTHLFFYDNVITDAEIGTYRVEITSAEKMKDAATGIAKPLQVTVPLD